MPIKNFIGSRDRQRDVSDIEGHLNRVPVLLTECELSDGSGQAQTENLWQPQVHGSDQDEYEIDGNAAGDSWQRDPQPRCEKCNQQEYDEPEGLLILPKRKSTNSQAYAREDNGEDVGARPDR